MLLIVSGPSGVGKSRLLDLAEQAFAFRRVVPITTRLCRSGEKPGHHYHFVSRKEFRRMILEHSLTAWDYTLGNYYGYSNDLAESIKSGQNTVIQALSRMALRIAKAHSNVFLVAMKPSSNALLEFRLKSRNYGHSELTLRQAHWEEEIELSSLFDVVIENADVAPTPELTITLAEVINRFA